MISNKRKRKAASRRIAEQIPAPLTASPRSAAGNPAIDATLSIVTLFNDRNVHEIFELYASKIGVRPVSISSFRHVSRLLNDRPTKPRLFVHDCTLPPSLPKLLLMIWSHWHLRGDLCVVLGKRESSPVLHSFWAHQRDYELSRAGVANLLQEATRAMATALQARRSLRAHLAPRARIPMKPTSRRYRFSIRFVIARLRSR
jgi:hypothetical protein